MDGGKARIKTQLRLDQQKLLTLLLLFVFVFSSEFLMEFQLRGVVILNSSFACLVFSYAVYSLMLLLLLLFLLLD